MEEFHLIEIDLTENLASSILGTDTFKAIEEVDKELAELYLPNTEAEDLEKMANEHKYNAEVKLKKLEELKKRMEKMEYD